MAYIGQHKSQCADNKYRGSGLILNKAIEKYGKNTFDIYILSPVNNIPTVCINKNDLDNSEIYYIKLFNAVKSDMFYNLSPGGQGGDTGHDFKGTNNPMFGSHRIGAQNPMYSKKHSEESKQKMRNSIKINGGRSGEKSTWYGKKLSESHIFNMKQSKLDENGNYKYRGELSSHYGKHENHPCFNTHRYNNGEINIKAKVCPEGFVLGRIMSKQQCPYCEYINNPGNIAQHIIKYHAMEIKDNAN